MAEATKESLQMWISLCALMVRNGLADGATPSARAEAQAYVEPMIEFAFWAGTTLWDMEEAVEAADAKIFWETKQA